MWEEWCTHLLAVGGTEEKGNGEKEEDILSD
jgi:hypothetical protein